jgi:hypothetical protein
LTANDLAELFKTAFNQSPHSKGDSPDLQKAKETIKAQQEKVQDIVLVENSPLTGLSQISKLKKKVSEAESAAALATTPSGGQPARLQLFALEEEVKRLKLEVAQKDVELSQKELEVKVLRQKLVVAESQEAAAQKISAENIALREALQKVQAICGDVLVD